jgi:hypothetical protein
VRQSRYSSKLPAKYKRRSRKFAEKTLPEVVVVYYVYMYTTKVNTVYVYVMNIGSLRYSMAFMDRANRNFSAYLTSS